MPNRTYTAPNADYSFGFNGQEIDIEISGIGNSNTAQFWQYDCRVGRRWNLDPIVNHHRSGFTTFSNNPIICIDPLGNTDYYNANGKWIGSDGIDDGKKMMVLSYSTSKIIKKATKQGSYISMNVKVYNDIIEVPSAEVVEGMDNVYTRTENSGNEEGMAVGLSNSGEEVIEFHNGDDNASYSPQEDYENITDDGGSGKYDIHSHPPQILYDPESEKEYFMSGPTSSPGDQTSTPEYEEAYGRSSLNIVLGYQTSTDLNTIPEKDKLAAKKKPGDWVPRSGTFTKVITFYDASGDVRTLDYEKFKRVTQKIRDHEPPGNVDNECSN